MHFSEKSAFGRPILYATRGEVKRFKAVHYRRSGGQRTLQKPLTAVPPDYDERLKCVRQRLRLSQDDLARLIGAAGKAVVYQWEVRKRRPSPVFWERIEKVDDLVPPIGLARVGRSANRMDISPMINTR